MKHRLPAALLSTALALSVVPGAGLTAAGYDTPSPWAQDAVSWLQSTGRLTESGDFSDYGRNVTRAEFARLSVVMCQHIANKWIPDDISAPFPDAAGNPWIAKAYWLNIIKGKDDGTFGPGDPITREQIATMLLRMLDACEYPYSKADVSGITFSDEAELGSWAAENVKRAYLIKILNGTGGNSMSPKAYVTLEQAYQMMHNIYSNRYAIYAGEVREVSSGALGTLTLKYTKGGQDENGWCETAYNAEPVVCDLEGDGSLEIVAAAYSLLCLDAATGAVKWRAPLGYDRSNPDAQYQGRVWADVHVSDIDADGKNEIILGTQMGSLAVYDCNGYFKSGWPCQVTNQELKSVAVADLDGDGTMEIVTGAAIEDGINVWVYEHNGSLRPGWPQLSAENDGQENTSIPLANPRSGDLGYAWGIYNDNIGIGDIDGDRVPEIVVPSDVPHICAYKPDGTPVRAGADFGGVVWGRVGGFADGGYELKVPNGGWGIGTDLITGAKLDLYALPMSERVQMSFSYSKALIEDLDNDGDNEIAVMGLTHDRAVGFEPTVSQGLLIYHGDHTRYSSNWMTMPEAGKVLDPTLDLDRIERCMGDPVACDLDGDGKKEVLMPSYAGNLSCFWLDGTQHDNWPLNVYDGSVLEYASTPAIYDLNGDGSPEVIFTTFTEKKGTKKGSLCIASAKGELIQSISLPDTPDGTVANGCLVPPVIADVDGDGKAEIVLHTYTSGVTVYDLD